MSTIVSKQTDGSDKKIEYTCYESVNTAVAKHGFNSADLEIRSVSFPEAQNCVRFEVFEKHNVELTSVGQGLKPSCSCRGGKPCAASFRAFDLVNRAITPVSRAGFGMQMDNRCIYVNQGADFVDVPMGAAELLDGALEEELRRHSGDELVDAESRFHNAVGQASREATETFNQAHLSRSYRDGPSQELIRRLGLGITALTAHKRLEEIAGQLREDYDEYSGLLAHDKKSSTRLMTAVREVADVYQHLMAQVLLSMGIGELRDVAAKAHFDRRENSFWTTVGKFFNRTDVRAWLLRSPQYIQSLQMLRNYINSTLQQPTMPEERVWATIEYWITRRS